MSKDLTISIFSRNINQLPEYLGKVDSDFYHLFKRHILFKQHETVDDKLKYILYHSGWIYIPTVINDINEYLNTIDIHTDIGPVGAIYTKLINSNVDIDIIKDLIIKRYTNEELFIDLYQKLIDHIGIFDLREFLGIEISKILEKDVTTEIDCLVDSLWNLKFELGGNNVGSGEVCLTILTGARKASIGDLKLPDNSRQVEIKCTKGRVGSKQYAIKTDYRIANILNISPEEFKKQILFNIEKESIGDKIDKLQLEIRTKRENLRQRIRQANIQVTDYLFERQSQNKKIPLRTINSINNIKTVKRFLWDVGKYEVPKTGIGTGINVAELNSIKKLYNKLNEINNINYDTYHIYDTSKLTFFQTIKNVFINNRFNISSYQLFKCFYECRNHELNKTNQELLYIDLYNFFMYNPIFILRQKESLDKLIISLHIYCYWIEHKFTDIHFINSRTKHSFILHLPLNTINAFDFIFRQIPDKLKTTLSLGGQNPTGVETYLESL